MSLVTTGEIMIREKGLHKRFVKVGPGGFKCGCCWPQSSRGHKSALRTFRRSAQRFFERLLQEALE